MHASDNSASDSRGIHRDFTRCLIGIAGFVRIGALLISAGTGVIALSQWSARRIERYLPLVIAVVLFGLALALPKGL